MPLTHFYNEHHRFFCRQFLCENASSFAFLVDKSVLHVECNGRVAVMATFVLCRDNY